MNDGRDFEARVKSTLQLSGLLVSPEQLIDGKKVDLVATQLRFGGEWRILVECKDYGRALTRKSLNSIWLDYQPSIASGHANELLVVTRVPAAPAAITFANLNPSLTLRTLADLDRHVMDFGEYLSFGRSLFVDSADGVAAYYVGQATASGDDILKLLTDWVSGESAVLSSEQPVAVLGAYGMGKSVLSRKLASNLAETASNDPMARIPIHLQLGDIAKEQSLEGLLGAHFSAHHNVGNYSFARFMEMNRNGRFVTILDGFDEMKHLLTRAEFRFNFSELGRLHAGDSRLLVLGRPTAFENDEEIEEVLHGSTPNLAVGTSRIDYQEVQIAGLSTNRIRQFLENYIVDIDTRRRVEKLISLSQFDDIASRPVQLRMLAQVLPSFEGPIEGLDLPTLYELVISDLLDAIIEREVSKGSRLSFSKQERRTFLQSLAYWLWSNRASTVVTSDQIPDELIEQYSRPGAELEAVRRDLVTASPLDRRTNGRIFFPHRSFQEFLVALESVQKLRDGIVSIDEFDDAATTEVADFAIRAVARPTHSALSLAVGQYRGSLKWPTARILAAWSADLQQSDPSGLSPWEFLARILSNIDSGRPVDSDWVLNWLRGTSTRDVSAALLALFSLSASRPNQKLSPAEETAVEAILTAAITRGEDEYFTNEHLVALSGDGPSRGARDRRADGMVQRKLQMTPLRDGMVGDLREGRARIGYHLGKGRLIRPDPKTVRIAANGARDISIRWLPRASVGMAEKLQSGRVDIRSMSTILAGDLPNYAFISNWLQDGKISRSISFPKPFEVGAALRRSTLAIVRAFNEYDEFVARNR